MHSDTAPPSPTGPRDARALPDALDNFEEIAARLADRKPALFLDFDGTLAPIVERPEDAFLPAGLRPVLENLAYFCRLAVVSGRDRADVELRVGTPGLIYAGSHGFDIAGPEGVDLHHEVGREFIPALDEAEGALQRAVAGIEGVQIDRKRYSIAIHFRRVPEARETEVADAVQAVVEARPHLRQGGGKKVFEVQPRLDWNKGKAVLWLLDALGLADDAVLPIYIGDDLTDEDAFRALAGRGIGIVVAAPRPSAARYRLRDPEEVAAFLRRLTDHLSGPRA